MLRGLCFNLCESVGLVVDGDGLVAAESQWGKLALPSQTPAADSKWHCEDPLHPAIDWTVTPTTALPPPLHPYHYVLHHTNHHCPALALPLPCHHHFTPVLHHCHYKSPRPLQTITAHHHNPVPLSLHITVCHPVCLLPAVCLHEYRKRHTRAQLNLVSSGRETAI